MCSVRHDWSGKTTEISREEIDIINTYTHNQSKIIKWQFITANVFQERNRDISLYV